MLDSDLLIARPTLTSGSLLARTLELIGRSVDSPTEIWRRLTESYVVDLDDVAELMPCAEPEPIWLSARD